MSPYFPSVRDAGRGDPNVILIINFAFWFYETPFSHSQNWITFHKIQNKFENKYSCCGHDIHYMPFNGSKSILLGTIYTNFLTRFYTLSSFSKSPLS